jgi:hypothetical protein
VELGVSKGSISLWVRELPKPKRRDPSEQAKLAARKRWEHERSPHDTERQAASLAATKEIGALSERELFLIGVGLYWSEGAKSKPGSSDRVILVNSDPRMIVVFLARLELLGIERERLRFSVNIHESADIPAAEAFWAQYVGIEVGSLLKTSLKKHNLKTNCTNTSTGYHGCFRVSVLRSADLYRRVEGWWCGIVEGVSRSPEALAGD